MIASWLFHVAFTKKPAVFIIGTDPAFSQLMSPFLKLLAPRSKIVFWCFDLYPDAVLADHPDGLFAKFGRPCGWLFKFCYRYMDVIAELGPCMRRRLARYVPDARFETLLPWALVEPSEVRAADPALRRSQFGDARLVLLYSGNLGRAHEFEPFLALARAARTRRSDIVFAFSVRGHRTAELKVAVTEADTNIRILPFADESVLQDHLEAADIHLVSLRPEWAGIVIPSKFFGSLAAGRPVIFAGPRSSSIATWIEELEVGLILDAESQTDVLNRLDEMANSPEQLCSWKYNAFAAYRRLFCKRLMIEGWDTLLRTEVVRRVAIAGGARLPQARTGEDDWLR